MVELIKAGHTELMEQLYKQNLPMIKQMCAKFSRYEAIEDLVQESYFGVQKAVENFSSSYDTSFLTYLLFWIKYTLNEYVSRNGSTVKMSSNKRCVIMKMRRFMDIYEKTWGKMPSDNEIAAAILSTETEIKELKPFLYNIESLDKPLSNEDESTTISDTLVSNCNVENDVIDSIYNEYEKKELWKIVEESTSELENNIIYCYYHDSKSLNEIGRERNITPERVRVIRNDGLRKLKVGKGRKKLMEKLYILDCKSFNGSLCGFKAHNNTSVTEHIALKRFELEKIYKE